MSATALKIDFKELLARTNAVIEPISIQDLLYVDDDPDTVIVDVRDTACLQVYGSSRSELHCAGHGPYVSW